MKSPFPGMDPYLERHWPDVHGSLVIGARDALNAVLPEDLVARTEELAAIESDVETVNDIVPDARVFEAVERSSAPAERDPFAEPTRYSKLALIEPVKGRFIEITDAKDQHLVTVIEFLSPGNKVGKGLDDFVEKRRNLLAGGVNFVEIDLIRAGDWRKLLRPRRPPREVDLTYRATIRAVTDPQAVYYQPISLREPLPVIKIPLRHDDRPAELPLQPLIERAYVNGRYGRTLDYTQPPDPPLQGTDAAWAEQLLRSAGKR